MIGSEKHGKVVTSLIQDENINLWQEWELNKLIAYNLEKVEKLEVLKFKKIKQEGDKKYYYKIRRGCITITPKKNVETH
jgi:hypothetical protein